MNCPSISWLAGPAGHMVDLARIWMFRYAPPHSYSKYRQIIAAARRTGARVLVETGTYKGVTTRRCLPHFGKVITIELDTTLAAGAKSRFKSWQNCEVIQGDAAQEVARILERADMDGDILFFLDGHFSGGDTACGQEPEPALDVLRTIAAKKKLVAGIIVDDFREFGTQGGWPTKTQLIAAAESLFAEFDLVVHLDQLLILRRAAA